MSSLSQLDYDLFRIVLYRENGEELLLENDDKGLALPNIPIPRFTRVAQQITEAIRRNWKLQTVCLFPIGERNSPVYAVELCDAGHTHPATTTWLPIHTVTERDFREAQDFHAIEVATKLFDQYRRTETAGPFARLGWLRDVTGWVKSEAAPISLHLTGEFQQLNASPTFSLIRFETDGPALWLKAVGRPNLHEYSITPKLAMAFPEFVPRVIALHPDWNAWLSVEAEGSHLTADSSLADWRQVVSAFARLQLATLGNALHFIDAGCKDVRTSTLESHVNSFFDFVAELMDQQTKLVPAPLSREQIRMLACSVQTSLECLGADGFPNVLGHMDLNPENVLVGNHRCVFLDWAEGAVGHPFFSFEYLREHCRKLRGADAATDKALISAYAKEWQSFASPVEIATTLEHTPLVAAFAFAALGMPWKRSESPSRTMAPYLRSLTRRMNRESYALKVRRLVGVV